MSRLGVAFLMLGLVISGSAQAKILFVCGATSPEQQASRSFELRSLEPVRVSATPDRDVEDGQIALVFDTGGYDIRLNYGDRAERSLREEGAGILATPMGNALIHVIVAPETGGEAEHFIFSADHDGLGSVVWGAFGASETRGANSGLDNEARCIQP